MKLYEITQAYEKILELQEEGGDWEQSLADLGGMFEEKVENIAKVIKNLQAEEEAYKAEADRMAAKATAAKNKAKGLKDYLCQNMQAKGLDKIKSGVLSVRVNESLAVMDLDELAMRHIDSRFLREIPARTEVDKRRLMDAYRADNTIPEAQYVGVRKSIVIR